MKNLNNDDRLVAARDVIGAHISACAELAQLTVAHAFAVAQTSNARRTVDVLVKRPGFSNDDVIGSANREREKHRQEAFRRHAALQNFLTGSPIARNSRTAQALKLGL